MATNIAKTLIIGIGGTGMDTILATKKYYVDTYGLVPPMVGFLGIDTDDGYYTRSIKSRVGHTISLNAGEICKIQSERPNPIYQQYQDIYDWMPTMNERYLQSLKYGAGQVRTNGRFAISLHYSSVVTAITNKINDISNARILDHEQYSAIGQYPQVQVIFSLGGGTGCGAFIDVLYMLRSMPNLRNSNIYAYGVLPDVFEAMMPNSPAMANVRPNCYGALMDLDYLVHSQRSFRFKYPNHEEEISQPPFLSMTLVGNRNSNGDIYLKVSQLTDMLGLAIVANSGDFGAAGASPMDNVNTQLPGMAVSDKQAWILGLGVSQILFDSNLLAKVYGLKAARRLITKMTNMDPDIEMDSFLLDWIDSAEVDIREHDKDATIDKMCSKSPRIAFEEGSIGSDPRTDVNNYLDNDAMPKADVIEENAINLISKLREELTKKLVAIMKNDYGVGVAEKFLADFAKELEVYASEMTSEITTFKDKLSAKEKSVESDLIALKDAMDLNFFNPFKSKRVAEAKESLVTDVNSLAVIKREILRREKGLMVFNSLKETVAAESVKVGNFKSALQTIDSNIALELSNINNAGKEDQPFVIALHKEVAKDLNIDSTQVNVPDFAHSIEDANKIYGIAAEATTSIREKINAYTQSLSGFADWKSKSIDSIIGDTSSSEYNRIIKLAIQKSSPLLTSDYGPHIPPSLYESFIIGVPNKDKTAIVMNSDGENYGETKKTFKDLSGIPFNPSVVSTGASDNIIIYRVIGAIPPFALSGVLDYKEAYDRRTNINCHFDRRIEAQIKAEGFSLFPQASDREALELWVKGIIFGKIKNTTGKYIIETRTPEITSAVQDWKYCLNEGKYNDRASAFAEFKRIRNMIKDELGKYIEEKVGELGTKQAKDLFEDVKANYYDKYSQINLKKETLITGGATYAPTRKQIENEQTYIDKNLA